MENKQVLKVNEIDNVIVALRDLDVGTEITYGGETITLQERIPAKHKFTTADIGVGEAVIMYGIIVGRAVQPIPRGGLISTENIIHDTAVYSTQRQTQSWMPPDVSHWQGRTFMGYHRPDGKVGTANHWLVIPLVFCENRNVYFLRQALEAELGYARYAPYQTEAHRLVQMVRDGADRDEITTAVPGRLSEENNGETAVSPCRWHQIPDPLPRLRRHPR